jgi:shikimate dehydrogenase
MKKFFVIGNPIEHSLSPLLHNYWIKSNNIDSVYGKEKLNKNDLKLFISKIRNKEINGANITVPFKSEIINHLDKLSFEAEKTQSVNTVFLEDDKIIGANTDIRGFELAIKNTKFDLKKKKAFIIGAGGVVPSIVLALKNLGVSKIIICNRTIKKAKNLNLLFEELEVVPWGEVPNFDITINATSLGLNKSDKINLKFPTQCGGKLFYDVIYNPKETFFLKEGKKLGAFIENGKMMFIHQAAASFKIWHGIEPIIDSEVIGLLDQ